MQCVELLSYLQLVHHWIQLPQRICIPDGPASMQHNPRLSFTQHNHTPNRQAYTKDPFKQDVLAIGSNSAPLCRSVCTFMPCMHHPHASGLLYLPRHSPVPQGISLSCSCHGICCRNANTPRNCRKTNGSRPYLLHAADGRLPHQPRLMTPQPPHG
jgi:hypothetical protein